jgi:hypothetical protein
VIGKERPISNQARRAMGFSTDLFKFSAKVGCLEGYLHERKNGDISTLPNWVGNIERMYRNLPEEVKMEVQEEYRYVLKKIVHSAENILETNNPSLIKLQGMLVEVS